MERAKAHLAKINWNGQEELICSSRNKAVALKQALRILRAKHGTGDIDLGGGLFRGPIKAEDIIFSTLPFYEMRGGRIRKSRLRTDPLAV